MSIQPFLAVPSLDSLHRVTVAAYGSILQDSRTLNALWNTVILGVAAAVGSMVLAFFVSWILTRSRSRAKVLLDMLAFAPHAFPGVVIGISVALLYLLLPLPIYGTVWIIVIAVGTQYVSLGTRLMNGAIAQIHVRLEEAGATSGASWHHILRRILLPLVLPGFVLGTLLIFVVSIRNLTLALMLYSPASEVVATLIWTRWNLGDAAQASVLGVLLSAVAVVMSVVLRHYEGAMVTMS